MAIVEITPALEEEINKRFKKETINILKLFYSLEQQPKKGKPLGVVGGIALKEIKYKTYRFYFITDAHKIRFYKEEELTELLIRFVRMSNKKEQQKTIEEIRNILRIIGPQGL